MRGAFSRAAIAAILLACIASVTQAATTSHSDHDHGDDEDSSHEESSHTSHDSHTSHEEAHFEAAAVYDVEAGTNSLIAYPSEGTFDGEESFAFMIVSAASADEEGLEGAEEDAEAGTRESVPHVPVYECVCRCLNQVTRCVVACRRASCRALAASPSYETRKLSHAGEAARVSLSFISYQRVALTAG